MSVFSAQFANRLTGRALRKAALYFSLSTLAGAGLAQPALAAACPGNPDALGTSRTLVVDPMEHPRIGTMQYPATLPLQDHEVVLTFDDGPLPPHSTQVLQILAAQCVKATFFIIGRMAHQFPEGVRRVRDAGHTIGTHSENHPLNFNKMPPERIKQEIDDGIAHTAAALGNASEVAPFFRVPGLRRGEVMEDYLVSKGIQSWSADFPADDWRPISADQVYNYAISRIEAKGRGILLLHDIQARTVAALPRILQTLKARGYRIVHVVPATATRPKTPTQPWQWQIRPRTDSVAVARWPRVPRFRFTQSETLPGPALSDSEMQGGKLLELDLPLSIHQLRTRHGVVAWPLHTSQPQQMVLHASGNALPVPSPSVFAMPEKVVAMNYGVTPMRRSVPRRQASDGHPAAGAKLTSTETDVARRVIPGSQPITRPGLTPALTIGR
jgi:peptidoglycan/xylan/chitin deacetylase (PgdA/CDA1 family)